jgi:putative membrane protein
VIRFLVRTFILLVANAVGLIVAAVVLDDMTMDVQGFLIDLVIFTIVLALMTPFLESSFRRGRAGSSALGGVALIATLIALVTTDVLAAVIVWVAALIAAFILPFLGLRRFMEERRD